MVGPIAQNINFIVVTTPPRLLIDRLLSINQQIGRLLNINRQIVEGLSKLKDIIEKMVPMLDHILEALHEKDIRVDGNIIRLERSVVLF